MCELWQAPTVAQQDPLKCAILDCSWMSPSPKGPPSCKRWVFFFDGTLTPFPLPRQCSTRFTFLQVFFFEQPCLPDPPCPSPLPLPPPPQRHLQVVFLLILYQYTCALDACQVFFFFGHPCLLDLPCPSPSPPSPPPGRLPLNPLSIYLCSGCMSSKHLGSHVWPHCVWPNTSAMLVSWSATLPHSLLWLAVCVDGASLLLRVIILCSPWLSVASEDRH